MRSDILAPSRLAEDQRGTVVVDVLRSGSGEGGSFEVSMVEALELHLSTSGGVRIEGEDRRSLDPDRERRSGPAVFYVRGAKCGVHDLTLDIRQRENLLSTVRFQVEVEPEGGVREGYDKDHPRAELLKLKGLHVGVTSPIPAEFNSEAFLDFAMERFEGLVPVHHWLVKALP